MRERGGKGEFNRNWFGVVIKECVLLRSGR